MQDKSTLESSSRILALLWDTIEFGVYLPFPFEQNDSSDNGKSRRFHSYWSFSTKNESTESNTVYLKYYPDNISIYCRKCEPKEEAFRITINKKDLKMVHHESNEENSALYFQLHHLPNFFREDIEKNQPETPPEKIVWKKVKNLCSDYGKDDLLKDFFLTNMVIKVTGKDWDTPLKDYDFTKIITEPCANLPPRLIDEDLIQADLTFDVKYLIRVWLSHRKATIFELSKDFLTKLEKLDQKTVEKTCLDIAKTPFDFYCRDKLPFDKLFDLVYEKNELLRYTWENLEEHSSIHAPKSVTITPNIVFYNIGLSGLSNGVLGSEKYKNEAWKVLRVAFREDNKHELWRPLSYFDDRFIKLFRCLPILDREYEFLAYSASQLRKGCAWMCLKEENESLAERVRKDIGNLSGIKVVPKYAARLGQLFSSSFGNIKINYESIVKRIEEKKSEWRDAPFSEGIGKISQSLMNEIQLKYKIYGKLSAIQIRLGSIKGVLTVDPELEGDQICFRDSMKKWPSSEFENSLNVLNYSKYEPAYLVRQIIYLLCFLGIDDQVFLDIQQENIRDLLQNENENKDLTRYIRNGTVFPLAAQLLKNCFDKGIEVGKEPFLQGVTRVTTIRALINVLGKRCVGPFVKDGAVLFGVLDEYDILEEGEIYVCVSPSNGEDVNDIKIVEGETIVTKTPCLYPGDLRKLKAVGKERVRNKFDHIVNCIVFPAKGKRPVTNMISGSDLDGDTYFVSWDKRLIPRETVDAISYDVEDFPKELKGKLWVKDGEVNLDDILKHYERFWRDKIGQTTNNYVRFMDQSLHQGDHKDQEKRKVLLKELEERTQVFSLVVDYGKSGREWNREAWERQKFVTRPAHMIKSHEDKFQQKKVGLFDSTSVLAKLAENITQRNEKFAGKIAGCLKEYKEGLPRRSLEMVKINKKMIIPGFKEYLQLAFDLLVLYYEQTLAFMLFNGIKSEYEVFSGSFLKFVKGSRNRSKKLQDLEKLQENCMAHIESIKQRSMALIETELGKRKQRLEGMEVRNKVASAVYIATYYNEACEIEEVKSAITEIENTGRFFVFDFRKIPQLLGLPWYLFKDVLLEKLL